MSKASNVVTSVTQHSRLDWVQRTLCKGGTLKI